MESILNKLQYSASCQPLPKVLRHYLKNIIRGNKLDALAKTKEMEEVDLDDSQNNNNFIFESSPHGDNFAGKEKILEDLLERFNRLPDKCKARAMPVKEYIENHLGMLHNMLNTGGGASQKSNKPKKSIEKESQNFKSEDELIQEQLESLGLGKQKKFKPQFDLDELIEKRKMRKASTTRPHGNVNKRDVSSVPRTKKYDKLADAVRRFRLRREGEERLGEMYGRSKEAEEYEGFGLGGGSEDMSKADFESPLVYSL